MELGNSQPNTKSFFNQNFSFFSQRKQIKPDDARLRLCVSFNVDFCVETLDLSCTARINILFYFLHRFIFFILLREQDIFKRFTLCRLLQIAAQS